MYVLSLFPSRWGLPGERVPTLPFPPARCSLSLPCRRPDPTRSLTLNMDVQAGSVTVHKAGPPDLSGGVGGAGMRSGTLRRSGSSSRLHRTGGSGGSGLVAFSASTGTSPVGSVLLGAAGSAPGSPREGGGGAVGGGHVSWADEVIDGQMASLLESALLDVSGARLGPARCLCLRSLQAALGPCQACI